MSYLVLSSEYQSISDFKRYIRQGLQGSVMILDRDGILNEKMEPRKYLDSFDQLIYKMDYIETFRVLGSMGFNFVIASNQPGIGTGQVAPEFLSELHRKMTDDLRAMGVNILAFYVCKHHWDDNCECRKPKPGMLNQIVSDFDLTPNSTYFVGDEDKDMQAAESAGVKGVKFPNIEFLHLFT
jgi:D-glycero-D-manno-heptose 1,7-bisphosphate phosphatase